MYSLAIAHTNDFLEQNEIVAASSAFVRLIGIGSILGPIMVSAMMSLTGPNGFHIFPSNSSWFAWSLWLISYDKKSGSSR